MPISMYNSIRDSHEKLHQFIPAAPIAVQVGSLQRQYVAPGRDVELLSNIFFVSVLLRFEVSLIKIFWKFENSKVRTHPILVRFLWNVTSILLLRLDWIFWGFVYESNFFMRTLLREEVAKGGYSTSNNLTHVILFFSCRWKRFLSVNDEDWFWFDANWIRLKKVA